MKNKLLIALTICTLTACATPLPENPRPSHWAQSVKADANLYRVDDKLYRSEQPITDDRNTIEAHDIRTIINLRFFNRGDDKTVFTPNSQIKLINQPLLTWSVSPKDLAQVLHHIEQNQKDGAVLVHCYHGADRTGIVIAFYRMIYQNWSPDDAKAEMLRGGFGYHSVWKNLENMFTEEKIAQVKAELAKLRK